MVDQFTQNGESIETLSRGSGKKVNRTCDFCGVTLLMSWRDILRQRKSYLERYGIERDRCHNCQILDVCKERFTKPKNKYRYVGGYRHMENPSNGKFMPEHRLIMEQNLGRRLFPEEVVHHIDGDKLNNRIDNLHLMPNEGSHIQLHRNIEHLFSSFVKKGLVYFDKKNGEYLSKFFETLESSIGFESISIKQKKNKCLSRLDADTESEIIKGINRPIPLIAANMSTVINSDFYISLYSAGAFGFLHRALSEDAYRAEVAKVAKFCEWVPVSIGIGNDQYELAKTLIGDGANVILIDIAHGYSDSVINLGRKLKQEYPHIKMVVGNTTNIDMLYEVSDFADALKVGIAQGYACETKNTAGCTEKQFSAVLKFKELSKKMGIPIISDGGLREPADFTKSIAAGANGAMAGSIFAACPESAAEIIKIDNKEKKLYAGMASEYVQHKWKGGLKPGTCAEGGVRYLDVGKPLNEMLELWQGALRTGITYGGGTDVESFQKCVEFIRLV